MQAKQKKLMFGCLGALAVLIIFSIGLNVVVKRLGIEPPQKESQWSAKRENAPSKVFGDVHFDTITVGDVYALKAASFGFPQPDGPLGSGQKYATGAPFKVVEKRVLVDDVLGKSYWIRVTFYIDAASRAGELLGEDAFVWLGSPSLQRIQK